MRLNFPGDGVLFGDEGLRDTQGLGIGLVNGERSLRPLLKLYAP